MFVILQIFERRYVIEFTSVLNHQYKTPQNRYKVEVGLGIIHHIFCSEDSLLKPLAFRMTENLELDSQLYFLCILTSLQSLTTFIQPVQREMQRGQLQSGEVTFFLQKFTLDSTNLQKLYSAIFKFIILVQSNYKERLSS